MPDKPKQPPKDMTARLAEQVRRENREGKREPDPPKRGTKHREK